MPKSKLTRLLITFFFLLTSSISFGQGFQLSGTVQSARQQEAIPYVNIGIKKKNIGTATRPDGSFRITLKEENRQDTLTFSAIGYNELSLPVSSILSGNITLFELTGKTTILREVVISSKAPKIKKIGTNSRNPFLHGSAETVHSDDISELGKFIKLNNKTSELLSATVYLRSNKLDSATFRINLYKNAAGMPGERLVEKSIIRRLPLTQGWVTIPLEQYGLVVDEDFFLGIEYLPDYSKHEKYIFTYGAALGGSFYSRKASLGDWKKGVGGRLAAYVTVRQ
ncbi:carboxypeptidase-like regulatory domain-containing protein [Pontibacter sp. BT731]|uniref:carboxypeptidase-like regulatory domain-containing protein n=1 Tax=Pontibacter coccineus TaxID=3063328 RepID=UPI0026E146AF|nr:carboxypeptidase-like regulatory domain-containing protein [Pontibacter sp. BT731]MDO6391014.1 carboxypeptidase-like regulatory domain-containing protein [Pontibacter sp. BT731]